MTEPERLALSPAWAALAELARVLSDEPWRFGAAELAPARAAGWSEAALLHAIVQAAFFNYLNRVADATGIDFDYPTALPAMSIDRTRPALTRPAPTDWPVPASRFALASRPLTAERYARWRGYLLERDAPLSRRERRVLARVAAIACCDRAAVRELADGEPGGAREQVLAAFADRLSRAPWQLGAADLEPLRRAGLADEALLDAIAVTAHQNTASRLRLAGVDVG